MSNGSGVMIYVPKNVLDTLLSIKKSKGKKRNKDAWDDLNFYAGVGMNVDNFYSKIFGGGGKV